jgi:type VI secretion system protein
MFDLKMPSQPHPSSDLVALLKLAMILMLCLSLVSCAGTKKPAKVDSQTTAPPAVSAPVAAPPAAASQATASPASSAPKPAAPQAAMPKTGVLKTIVSLLTLTPSPLDLKVSIDPAANNNSPVELDVVLINDKGLWKAAPSMTATDWFAQKKDLERRYQKKLTVSSWEWVPGQAVNPIVIRVPRWLNGAMVFASYPSPGAHSAPLAKGGKVAISLGQDDFTLEMSK